MRNILLLVAFMTLDLANFGQDNNNNRITSYLFGTRSYEAFGSRFRQMCDNGQVDNQVKHHQPTGFAGQSVC